jgi:hypothetical protein
MGKSKRPLSMQKKKVGRSKVPIPQSYLAAVKEKREAAHKISGLRRVRARFVQGGGVSGR